MGMGDEVKEGGAKRGIGEGVEEEMSGRGLGDDGGGRKGIGGWMGDEFEGEKISLGGGGEERDLDESEEGVVEGDGGGDFELERLRIFSAEPAAAGEVVGEEVIFEEIGGFFGEREGEMTRKRGVGIRHKKAGWEWGLAPFLAGIFSLEFDFEFWVRVLPEVGEILGDLERSMIGGEDFDDHGDAVGGDP